MSKFESVVQGAVEKLLTDERLRGNLSDDEVNIFINWAVEWLDGRVAQAPDEASARQVAQAEIARLRPAMQQINRALSDGTALPDFTSFDVSSSEDAPAPEDAASTPRQNFIRRQVAQLSQKWKP
jgi:hypothetical protein